VSKNSIKPCPFCGGKARKHFGVNCKWDTEIECEVCGANMPYDEDKGECIVRWNERQPQGGEVEP
jgi:Lar family restriction alleviation protein